MRLDSSALRRSSCLAIAAALLAAAPARSDEMAEAKERFKRGQTHYALGEFTEAIAEFRDAYRLRDEPAILFNIAQAMRQLGQYKQAHFYYSQYLSRRPEASNRADVEQFMVQMRRKADAEEEAERVRREAEAARAALAPPAGVSPVALASPAGVSPVAVSAAVPPAGGPPAVAPALAVAPGVAVAPAAGQGGGVPPAASGRGPVAFVAAPPAAAGAAAGGAAEPSGAAPLDSLRPGPAPAWSGRRVLRYSGFGAIGAGVAAEGLALLFHASAQSSADELSRRYQSGSLQPSDGALQDNVASKGRLSTIAAVSGAVLVAAGAAAVLAF